jgi:hypothetical protein
VSVKPVREGEEGGVRRIEDLERGLRRLFGKRVGEGSSQG